MRDIENTCHICHYFCRSEMPLAHCPRCDADWTDITQEILLRKTSCHYRDGTFDGADGFLFITTQRIFWHTQGRPAMIYVANNVIDALGAMIMAAFNHAAGNKKGHAPKRLFSIQYSDLQTATIGNGRGGTSGIDGYIALMANVLTQRFLTRNTYEICDAINIRIRLKDSGTEIKAYYYYQSRIHNIVLNR